MPCQNLSDDITTPKQLSDTSLWLEKVHFVVDCLWTEKSHRKESKSFFGVAKKLALVIIAIYKVHVGLARDTLPTPDFYESAELRRSRRSGLACDIDKSERG
jgi:hypothetical protein